MAKGLRKCDLSDIDDIKEKIDFAKKAVSDEKEPFKTESFKIIFTKLLNSSLQNQVETISEHITEENPTSLKTKKAELAEKCSISKEELEDVFSIHQDSVKILAPIKCKKSFQCLIAAQCFLIVLETVLGKEWVESKELAQIMREIGIKYLSNLSAQLKRYPEIFRIESKPGHSKYKLTSIFGRTSAFEIIRKLAKGENLDES